MNKIKNILIAPLDWGLGHATRCIPIIKSLEKDFTVIIGTSGGAAKLLLNEFPHLKHIQLPSYHITYPAKRKIALHMLLQSPSILSAISQEKKVIQQAIQQFKIDLLISDNRFGVYSKNIPSIFITHQITIKSPQFNKTINKLNHRYIKKFNACWIPDYENNGLAGELSHPSLNSVSCKYIGPLTRFKKSESTEKTFDITVILSGPEPQRTLFEDLLFEQLIPLENLKINVVRGIYSSDEKGKVKNIHVYDNLTSTELEKMMHQSKNIICRSGYSSLMDLQIFDAKVLFVATPQQTEQEYLAAINHGKNNFYSQNQNEINILEFLKLPEQKREISQAEIYNFKKWIEEI